jgi:hypothetical protein
MRTGAGVSRERLANAILHSATTKREVATVVAEEQPEPHSGAASGAWTIPVDGVSK